MSPAAATKVGFGAERLAGDATRRTSAPAASYPPPGALLAAPARRGHRIVAAVRFLEAPLQLHYHSAISIPRRRSEHLSSDPSPGDGSEARRIPVQIRKQGRCGRLDGPLWRFDTVRTVVFLV
jgi:hypothetical protein